MRHDGEIVDPFERNLHDEAAAGGRGSVLLIDWAGLFLLHFCFVLFCLRDDCLYRRLFGVVLMGNKKGRKGSFLYISGPRRTSTVDNDKSCLHSRTMGNLTAFIGDLVCPEGVGRSGLSLVGKNKANHVRILGRTMPPATLFN